MTESETTSYTHFHQVEDEGGRRMDALDLRFSSTDMSPEAYEEGRYQITKWVSEQCRLVRNKQTDDSVF